MRVTMLCGAVRVAARRGKGARRIHRTAAARVATLATALGLRKTLQPSHSFLRDAALGKKSEKKRWEGMKGVGVGVRMEVGS